MELTKLSDFRDFDLPKLEKEILITKKKIFDIKIGFALKKETKSHLLRIQKKKLAQLLTIKHNKIT